MARASREIASAARTTKSTGTMLSSTSPRPGSGIARSGGEVSISNTSRYGPSMRSTSPVFESPTTIDGRSTTIGISDIAARMTCSAFARVSSTTLWNPCPFASSSSSTSPERSPDTLAVE
jgi:hypothetical protein